MSVPHKKSQHTHPKRIPQLPKLVSNEPRVIEHRVQIRVEPGECDSPVAYRVVHRFTFDSALCCRHDMKTISVSDGMTKKVCQSCNAEATYDGNGKLVEYDTTVAKTIRDLPQ